MTETAIGGELRELAADYEFIGELGRGGTAVVYHARDRGLGRDVAIKVVYPRPQSPGDDAVARLAREARTVAQLQHPNIVTVFAVRSLSGGGLALVMQLVPGRTLKALVQQDGVLSPERCEHVLRDVASALAYAHARGIVHRDVKPENIFVDEQSSRALLSDFGIARSDDHDSMTMTGTAIGTPFYMSPEQIDGTAIDGRSDLYSLGLVAWETLTGRRPWDGESLYNVIYKQKHEELPPVEALRQGVPPRLQYIIERMLQKLPRARWAGADALLSQLSHTVLPSDYSRWQGALRKRVERYHAAEKERERATANGAAEQQKSGGLFAATMRFVRGPRGSRNATARTVAEAAVEPSRALANTMRLPSGATIDTLDVAPVPVVPTLLEELPAAPVGELPPAPRRRERALSPTWDRPDPMRRTPWIVAGVMIVGVGAVLLVGTPTGASLEQLWGRALSAAQSSDRGTDPVQSRSVEIGDQLPASTTPLPPRMLIALGGRHSCAVTADASIQCWGANDRGQLGDGTAAVQLSPVRVAAQLTFATVAAGVAQSCGVTHTGDIYCWGNDTNGQLGDATTIRRNAPVRVAGPGVYRSVAIGDAHACAVTVVGALNCWGANARGQLGDSSNRQRTVPGPVAAMAEMRFVQVVTGRAHSCALRDDGAAICWGANDQGQLGAGHGPDRNTPVAVAGGLRFTALAAGAQHTCGLTTDATVACWGSNARRQLGTGARTTSAAPVAVVVPSGATAIAAGAEHSCVLGRSGEAYCWGANGAGQLGIGPAVGDVATPTRVATPEPLTAIAAGAQHSCASTSAGALLCWGANAEGEVGDATRLGRLIPVRVAFATK